MLDDHLLIRFLLENDLDASRVASVLTALGYRAVRVVETVEHAEAWGFSEIARRYLLSESEVSYLRTWIRRWPVTRFVPSGYGEEAILHKLGGRQPAEILADIVEVERRPIDHAVDMMAELPPFSEET